MDAAWTEAARIRGRHFASPCQCRRSRRPDAACRCALPHRAFLAPGVRSYTRARASGSRDFGLIARLTGESGVTLVGSPWATSNSCRSSRTRDSVPIRAGCRKKPRISGFRCLTLRSHTTERPVTVSEGTNRLISVEGLAEALATVLEGRWPGKGRRPDLWDGHTASRGRYQSAENVSAVKTVFSKDSLPGDQLPC